MQKELQMKVVVIGNGVAGATVAQKLANKGVDVALFSEEPVGFYSRILLPQALCDTEALQDLIAKTDPPYLLKKPATAIDPARKVVLSGKSEFPYDKLVIATGSRSRMLDIFSCTDGACTLRTFFDALHIGTIIEEPVVVLGGGLLGLETALSIKKKGFDVTVCESADRILVRQLDEQASSMLKEHLEGEGLHIREGVKTQAQKLDIMGHLRSLVAQEGEEIPCRTLLLSLGVLPEITLAKAAGLKTNRGILVDEHLLTSDRDILAIGDCAEFEGRVPGIMPVALAMAESAIDNLLGEETTYVPPVLFTRFKGSGVDVVSVGSIEGESRNHRKDNRYEAYFVKDGILLGAILFGSTEHLKYVRSHYLKAVSDDEIEALLSF